MRRERNIRLDIALVLASALLGASLLAIGTYRLATLATRQLAALEQRLDESHACDPDHDHDCAWRDD